MLDPFVMLAPVLLLAVVALLGFVGCDLVFPLDPVDGPPAIIEWQQFAENDPTQVDDTGVATTAPFGLPVEQGNLIVVWIFYKVAVQGVTAVTDGAGNQYQRAVGPTTGQGSEVGFRQELWWAENVHAGTGLTVTATFATAAFAEKAISAHEYHNAKGINPATTAERVGNEADASIGPVPVATGGMMFAAALFDTTGTAGDGFLTRSTLNTGNVAEERLFAEAGDHPASFHSVAQDHILQVISLLPKPA